MGHFRDLLGSERERGSYPRRGDSRRTYGACPRSWLQEKREDGDEVCDGCKKKRDSENERPSPPRTITAERAPRVPASERQMRHIENQIGGGKGKGKGSWEQGATTVDQAGGPAHPEDLLLLLCGLVGPQPLLILLLLLRANVLKHPCVKGGGEKETRKEGQQGLFGRWSVEAKPSPLLLLLLLRGRLLERWLAWWLLLLWPLW